MLLTEVLQKTIEIIGDTDISLNEESPKRKRLIACANMIYHELTTQYTHLKHQELLDFENGKLYFSLFSEKVLDVLSVKKNGVNIDFKIYPLYVQAEINGKCQVDYLYYSQELDLDDQMILPPQYTAFVVANGIASEYFYRSGFTDEAIFYKNRYDTAILNLSRKRQGVMLKQRRFV